MAKKNRGEEQQTGGFSISSVKVGKQKLITVTFQLTEVQDAHLSAIATENGTTRAEFCKQAVHYCLNDMGHPFPDAGEELSESVQQALETKREKREARAAARNQD